MPELLAFNKTDLSGPTEVKRLLDRHPESVALSAATGEGIDGLLEAVGERLRAAVAHVVELLVPYERGDVVAALHRQGEVLSEVHESDATRLRARLVRRRGQPLRRLPGVTAS